MEMNFANQMTDAGLTPGLLKVLHKQVFNSKSVPSTHAITYISIQYFHKFNFKKSTFWTNL